MGDFISAGERAKLGAIRPRPERTAEMLASELPVLRTALTSDLDALDRHVAEAAPARVLGATLPEAIFSDLARWRRSGDRAGWAVARLLASPFWRYGNLEGVRALPDADRRPLLEQQRGQAREAMRMAFGARDWTPFLDRAASALTDIARGRMPEPGEAVPVERMPPVVPLWREQPRPRGRSLRPDEIELALAIAQRRRYRHDRGETLTIGDLYPLLHRFVQMEIRGGGAIPTSEHERMVGFVGWWFRTRRTIEQRMARPIERLCVELGDLVERGRVRMPEATHRDAPLLRARRSAL